MLTELLTKDTIQLANFVNTWQEAIHLAASPLLKHNKIEERYIESMIQSIEKHGPYVVITPKVAIPHARHTDGVNELGMSLLSLQKPVLFGPEKPVFLIIILAATDNVSHLQALVDLTKILQEPNQIDIIITCQHKDDIIKEIQQIMTKE
ncbi:PTS sugar transporter subunit IIA [Lysinibacillus sp. CNPSo 3705]|uniref:PTS sugar transporter subunit IIA n=1 Tax=Lysinibacillus sp. CNPSo 3705 TaxID=3028148 RepID=UPI00104A97D3|nr:PTS sugar transporter subunit IIA [Lysinibacillus sp. CNPSo 3705]MDD1502623.1 PTS sugar transporter subunit IIA [Lysinibacillus sp. CNPSo 3705]